MPTSFYWVVRCLCLWVSTYKSRIIRKATLPARHPLLKFILRLCGDKLHASDHVPASESSASARRPKTVFMCLSGPAAVATEVTWLMWNRRFAKVWWQIWEISRILQDCPFETFWLDWNAIQHEKPCNYELNEFCSLLSRWMSKSRPPAISEAGSFPSVCDMNRQEENSPQTDTQGSHWIMWTKTGGISDSPHLGAQT